jgi:hypothetical protein
MSMSALAICTKPLARRVRVLWRLDRVLDTEGGIHDPSTPTHAGGSPATELLRTHSPPLHPHRCRVRNVLSQGSKEDLDAPVSIPGGCAVSSLNTALGMEANVIVTAVLIRDDVIRIDGRGHGWRDRVHSEHVA